jgi:hypothetical protein
VVHAIFYNFADGEVARHIIANLEPISAALDAAGSR